MTASYPTDAVGATPTARCLRVMRELFENPTRSSWPDLAKDPTVFEVDLRSGTAKRVVHELRPFLIRVRNHGASAGSAKRQYAAAYRWTSAALALLQGTSVAAPVSPPVAARAITPAQPVPAPPTRSWSDEDGLLVEELVLQNEFGTTVYRSENGGRWTAHGADNAQCLPRELRMRIVPGIDIDAESCHPNLLVQMLERWGVDLGPFDALVSVAKYPKMWRQHVAEQLGIPEKDGTVIVYGGQKKTKRDAKTLMLALQYGASSDEECPGVVRAIIGDSALPPAVVELVEQMRAAAKVVEKHSKHLWEQAVLVRKRKQARGEAPWLKAGAFWSAVKKTLVSLAVQAEERKVLDASVAFCHAQGVRVLVLQHDGMMVEKPVDLAALSDYVQKTTGFRLVFARKE